MVAPDVRYFFDCSLELGHIPADAYYFFMSMCQNTNQLFDQYEELGRERRPRHLDSLMDQNIWLEHQFVNWRNENEVMRPLASYAGLLNLRHVIPSMIKEYALEIHNKGFTKLTPEAMTAIKTDYYHHWKNGVRRTLNRAEADLKGKDIYLIDCHLRELHKQNLEKRALSIMAIRGLTLKDAFKAEKERNRAAKRAVKFMSRLVGDETTRLFIGNNAVHIRGQNATYKLQASGGRMGHGSSSVTVLNDDGEQMCRVCIYTEGVPVADHISSLILHIKGGMEDEIMTAGNPYDVIRENIPIGHWVEKFIPPPKPVVEIVDYAEAIRFGEAIRGFTEPPKRNETVMRNLKHALSRDIYKDLVEPHKGLFKIMGGLGQNVSQGLLAAPYQ